MVPSPELALTVDMIGSTPISIDCRYFTFFPVDSQYGIGMTENDVVNSSATMDSQLLVLAIKLGSIGRVIIGGSPIGSITKTRGACPGMV